MASEYSLFSKVGFGFFFKKLNRKSIENVSGEFSEKLHFLFCFLISYCFRKSIFKESSSFSSPIKSEATSEMQSKDSYDFKKIRALRCKIFPSAKFTFANFLWSHALSFLVST